MVKISMKMISSIIIILCIYGIISSFANYINNRKEIELQNTLQNTLQFRQNLYRFIGEMEIDVVKLSKINKMGIDEVNEVDKVDEVYKLDKYTRNYIFLNFIENQIEIFKNVYKNNNQTYTEEDIVKLEIARISYNVELFYYYTHNHLLHTENNNDNNNNDNL
jgi:hypothetical protein